MTTFSATLVTTDLQLFFEMTRKTYTLDPKFAERWSKWILEMVKERLWNYSTAVMTTALGDEIYNDYLYPEEDANGGMHTLRKAYEEFAKNENKVWKKHTKIWIYKEDDYDESEEEVKCENCAHCGELMPCDNGCQTSHGFLCENCEDLYCCEDCGEIIEEDEEKFTSVDLERQLCEECYKEDERVTAEEKREAKKQRAKDEALPRLSYKCRVECPEDIERVLEKSKKILRDAYWFATTNIREERIDVRNGVVMTLPDREWTFTTPADLQTVKQIFGMVVNAHVGQQTVQLEANYT